MDSSTMFVPSHIFGHSARLVREFLPPVLGSCTIAGIEVEELRYDLVNFEVEGGLDTDGWIAVYRVSGRGREEHLIQGRSVFYSADDQPPPGDVSEDIAQGDGVTSPKWHKCDRSWPTSRDGARLAFVGQGYYDSQVVYLFESPDDGSLAIFTDDVSRQDAEEHYREEEERLRGL